MSRRRRDNEFQRLIPRDEMISIPAGDLADLAIVAKCGVLLSGQLAQGDIASAMSTLASFEQFALQRGECCLMHFLHHWHDNVLNNYRETAVKTKRPDPDDSWTNKARQEAEKDCKCKCGKCSSKNDDNDGAEDGSIEVDPTPRSGPSFR